MEIWLSLSFFTMLVCFAGYAITRIIARSTPVPLGDRLLFAFPLGGWGIGWLIFCAHVLGSLSISAGAISILLSGFAVTGGVWGSGDVMRWYRNRPVECPSPAGRPPSKVRWSRPAWILFFILAALLIRLFLECWTTPIHNADAFGYHLPYAKYVYQTHALPRFASPSPTDSGFAYPPLLFLLYAMEWLWLGTIHLFFPRMMVFVFTGLIVVLIYRTVRQVLHATPVVAFGTAMSLLLPGNYVEGLSLYQSSTDVPFLFWALATVYFLMLDLKKGHAVRWPLVGICGAMGCWTKPFGFPYGVVCIGVIMLSTIQARIRHSTTWPYHTREIVKLTALWGSLVAPFLWRNWLYWDNPLYPGFGKILGGYLVDAWSLQHYTFFAGQMGLFFDWKEILATVWREPGVALAGVGILHPAVRRNGHLRTAWLVAMGYLLFYLVMFGSPMRQLDHARYLLPTFVLLTVFVALFLDRRYNTGGWVLVILLVDGLIQGTRLMHEGIHTTLSLDQLSSFKRLAYEVFPLLLVGGFGGVALWYARRKFTVQSLRPGMIALSCALFMSNWPLQRPWRMVLQPLAAHPHPVDWTAVPLIEPFGPWVHEHLPESSVLLIRFGQRWIIPRAIVHADSPLLKKMYTPELSTDEQLKLLARLGVTHVCEGTMSLGGIASLGFACWPDVERVPYLKKIYQAPFGNSRYRVSLYEVMYPPDLQRVVVSPLARPWLYEAATVGILQP